MKKKTLNLIDKIIVALLGLFPFYSGCDEPREMYGTPTADYLVKGTVTDENTNTPIQNIRVIIRESRDTLSRLSDTIYTDEYGKYHFNFSAMPNNATYEIKTTDIDGVNNGGLYASETDSIYDKDGILGTNKAKGWYLGTKTFTKDFNLKKSE